MRPPIGCHEVRRCNGCGRGFHGPWVLETEPPANAPTGICHACQKDR